MIKTPVTGRSHVLPTGLIVLLLILFPRSLPSAEAGAVVFREDFASLVNWKSLAFQEITSRSTYTIERSGDRHVLRTESRASASAVIYKDPVTIRDHAVMKWRWKVRNVYDKADVGTKNGDDCPIRIYIMFEYDPDKADITDRIKYGLAKSLYGSYPPQNSLAYVWASKEDPRRFVRSPYTDKAMMILMEKGPAKAGTWVDEEADIVRDYRRAFGRKPPSRARIAVMNDSDNTGESAVSWLEYLEISE